MTEDQWKYLDTLLSNGQGQDVWVIYGKTIVSRNRKNVEEYLKTEHPNAYFIVGYDNMMDACIAVDES